MDKKKFKCIYFWMVISIKKAVLATRDIVAASHNTAVSATASVFAGGKHRAPCRSYACFTCSFQCVYGVCYFSRHPGSMCLGSCCPIITTRPPISPLRSPTAAVINGEPGSF